MNAINRRGQKIVCVIEFEYESGITGRLYPGPTPQVNEIYTVRDFLSPPDGIRFVTVGGDVPLDAFISLEEIPSPTFRIPPSDERTELGWPLACFRPVQTRETDISDLVKLTTPAKQLEPV